MLLPQKVECDRAMLERLLADELTTAEEHLVSQHLAGCADCQHALEALAAGKPLWNELQAHMTGEPATDSWSSPDQACIPDHEAWTQSFLALLDPTDDPHMLGRLGCYEIRGIIGRGGTGIVLKGFESRLNRYVAIKVLAPTLASNGAARKRFEREGRAIAAVSHEHVVPIYAVDEHRGLPYIVMQYFPAGTLQQRIDRGGPLEIEGILRAAMHIASGLAAAHVQGIIHRDIKPANVLLENDVNRVLVTDFGLARIADDVALTQSGLVAGTPQFMSPEQARGERIDERSDLFGLGSVMYVMSTGHPPFRAETVFGIIKRVCDATPRSIREINPHVPVWLEAFIGKLMAKEPSERFASAGEVATLLSRELAHLQNPMGTVPFERPWMLNPKFEATWSAVAKVATGVGVMLLLLGWFFGCGEKSMTESAAIPRPAAAPKPMSLQGAVEALKRTFGATNVTASADRNQMMSQLGVKLPDDDDLPPINNDPYGPAYARPDNPTDPWGNWTDQHGNVITRSGFGLWVSYDSGDAGNYTPIDLLKMHGGTKIKTAQDWWSKRRPEIFEDVQESLWGRIPPEDLLPAVKWAVHTTTVGTGEKTYQQKAITGVIDTSRHPEVRDVPRIEAKLRLPANTSGPVPVIVLMGNDLNLEPAWQYAAAEGWGVCAINCNRLQADDGGALTSYLIGLVNQGEWRKPSDWGTLVAWSWGVSRLIDHLETDADIDAAKIGVAGHARYGKAAIVAMAYEPRLAICYPSCAGTLGTKMMRRHWGQELESLSWEREYHWAAGNILKWMGPLEVGKYKPRKIEQLPVDAHSLLALAAPRPVFLNNGTANTWSDPYGTYLTGAAASPVYELLGKRGLVMRDDPPQPDVEYIEGDIGFRLHTGGHFSEPDWPTFVEFAKRYLNTTKPAEN